MRVLIFVCVVAALCVSSALAKGRAELAQQRHDNGTDAHGHNAGLPYTDIVGYVVVDGKIDYHYHYTRDPVSKKCIFNESAYAEIEKKVGCICRERLIDEVDCYFDLNGNHILDPLELPHVLDCLSDDEVWLEHKFNVHPTHMMDDCSVDGVMGVSASDFLISMKCLPSCLEREAAQRFVFGKLNSGHCKVNPLKKHSIIDVFGNEWEQEIGGKENLPALNEMYGLAPL